MRDPDLVDQPRAFTIQHQALRLDESLRTTQLDERVGARDACGQHRLQLRDAALLGRIVGGEPVNPLQVAVRAVNAARMQVCEGLLAGDHVAALGGRLLVHRVQQRIERADHLPAVSDPSRILAQPCNAHGGDDADHGQAGEGERNAALNLALGGRVFRRNRWRRRAPGLGYRLEQWSSPGTSS